MTLLEHGGTSTICMLLSSPLIPFFDFSSYCNDMNSTTPKNHHSGFPFLILQVKLHLRFNKSKILRIRTVKISSLFIIQKIKNKNPLISYTMDDRCYMNEIGLIYKYLNEHSHVSNCGDSLKSMCLHSNWEWQQP